MELYGNLEEIIGGEMRQRVFSLDLLKILSMLIVVVLHETTYGLHMDEIAVLGPAWFLCVISRCFSFVAVNCFVLISGYFLSHSDFKVRRVAKLWLQVLEYSLGLCFVLKAFDLIPIGKREIIKSGLPLLTNSYWFFTAYFVMVMISPLMNTVIDRTSKKELQKIIVSMMTVFVIVPTINLFGDAFGARNGYHVIWFVFLYLVAGYMRKYEVKLKKGLYLYACMAAVLVFLKVISTISGFHIIYNLTLQYNSIIVFLGSVGLFGFMKDLKINEKFGMSCSKISGLIFAVYLIHEHPLVRNYFWNRMSLQSVVPNAGVFAMKMICIPIVLMIISVIVEFLRQTIFGKIEDLVLKTIGI